MQECSDEELLEKYREHRGTAKSERWLDELFGRYHLRLAKWCYRFTGERERAADLAQDALLRAYRNLDSFYGGSKFSTWMYTIARNVCINEMKSRAARGEESAETLDLNIPATDGAGILQILMEQESADAARRMMMETLDEIERKVMVLHFAEGIKLDALGRLLGLTNASGAKAYLVSARRKLSAAMKLPKYGKKGSA